MHLLQNVINKRFPMYTKTPMRYKVSCHFLMDNSKKFDESCYKKRKFGNDFLFFEDDFFIFEDDCLIFEDDFLIFGDEFLIFGNDFLIFG